MRDLSIVIPARNEEFLARTVQDILENIRADTEIIVICDGWWPDPPLQDHPRLTVVHHESIGQRAATNEGVRLSQAKYVMKADAHCAFDEGFDAKLITDCQPDWTMIPAMWNLHVFDWQCERCGHRSYQGSKPKQCFNKPCEGTEFNRTEVWQRRKGRITVSWRFDRTLQFKYWNAHRKRPETKAQGDLIETMSFIGACMMMERKRYWDIDGLDEQHGSWGQFGTEIALKTWLSGGRLITSKKTWFAHLFRTGNFARNGESSWPYPISQKQIDHAREYSRDFWFNNKWPKAKYSLEWLVEKFKPVPDWHEETK